MTSIRRWFRSALVMGAIWGGVGAVVVLAVGVWSIATGHAHSPALRYLMSGVVRWVPISFLSGIAFATLITAVGRWRSLKSISPWYGAAAGAVVGASVIAVIAPSSADRDVVWALTGVVSAIAAAVGSGLILLSRRTVGLPLALVENERVALGPGASDGRGDASARRVADPLRVRRE